MPPIQLVVCDTAGTTIQDQQEVERCFIAAADRTGLKVYSKQVIAMMGWSKRLVFETLWADQIGSDHPDYKAQVDASFAPFKMLYASGELVISDSHEYGLTHDPCDQTEIKHYILNYLRGSAKAPSLKDCRNLERHLR